MARAIKPKPKLIDLFTTWREAQMIAVKAASGMSITPSQIRDEQRTYQEFYEALKKCNC